MPVNSGLSHPYLADYKWKEKLAGSYLGGEPRGLLAPVSNSAPPQQGLLEESGVAVRGAIMSVSASMRSDTQQRLPALPSLAREEGCAQFRG